ncbi:MAG: LamG-like jellyroll fold domain-containing protein [Candidatus Aenigmatarchaeota archaeon]
MSKAISAVISTVMLLMTTVSLIGVFYVFSSTLATQTTGAGGQQASQLTAQLSMCMQIDNIIGNRITLRNCGAGVIENKSLVVMMDDIALDANTNTIMEGNSSIVNISGLWQVPFGKHSLKISNGAAVALALVEIIPNPDGLAGSWNFDEGSGSNAYDASGNGNAGTLVNMNTTGNATSGWADGRFGNALQFDGVNDYVNAGNGTSLNIIGDISISFWLNPNNISGSHGIISRGNWGSNGVPYAVSTAENKIRFSYIRTGGGGVSYDSAFTILPNTYTYITITHTGTYTYITITHTGNSDGTLTFYKNGIAEIPRTTSLLRLSQPSDSTLIGLMKRTSAAGGYIYFNGTIDEVRVWNKAFAPDETVTMKKII